MRVRRAFVRVYLGLEGLKFGFDLGFVAFGTDAVAECNVSAGFDIAFDLLPVILVVAYLFAVGVDRQKPLQVLLAFDRCLQGAHSVHQRNLQVENAFAYLDSGLHFFAVEGFVEIIIGASLQCFGNIVFSVAGRELDDVEMLELCFLARLATDFDPVEVGAAASNRKPPDGGRLRPAGCHRPAGRRSWLRPAAPLIESRPQQQPRSRVVFGDQDLHRDAPFNPVGLTLITLIRLVPGEYSQGDQNAVAGYQ